MSIHVLERQQFVKQPLKEVFDFFSRAENLEKITPPWMRFRILTPLPIPMQAGTLIDYSIRIHGFPLNWRTLIESWAPPYQFVDLQLQGPYTLWHHTHRFKEIDGGTAITDVVRYQLPLGPLGDLVHWLWVRHDVNQIFDYRSKRVPELLL